MKKDKTTLFYFDNSYKIGAGIIMLCTGNILGLASIIGAVVSLITLSISEHLCTAWMMCLLGIQAIVTACVTCSIFF